MIGFESQDVLKKYLSVIRANLVHLVALLRGPCRYRHGTSHAYHTAREYAEAITEHLCVPDTSKTHTMKPTEDSI